ncbi:TPA: hypothetical protein SMI16_002264 [Serratia liquefaciens]|nr:hypothetical protein [Serratia liquefaciens]
MDKFSELKAAACIAATNFERWSKSAALTSEASSILHTITLLETSQLISAMLAELEAKDKRIANLEFEQGGYGYSVLEDLNGKIKRIAELEAYNARLRDWNLGLAQESWELQAKLATPVRLPDDGLDDCRDMWPQDCSDDFDTGYKFGLWRYEQNICAAGFTVEGDE